MNEVFISYSRKDTTFVRKLDARLREEGWDPWVDWEGIPLSADWWSEIEQGIEGADAFVFIISPDSVASDFGQKTGSFGMGPRLMTLQS